MIPILYKTVVEGTVPSDYGVGVLTDCITCEIKEQRNGEYELELTYAATGIHAEEIAVESVIKAKPNFTDDPQLFRIYKVGKEMAGKFTVNAHHISYDLSGKVITTGSAGSCAAACDLLSNAADNFTITTDKTATGDFTVTQPASVRSWFGGKEGSLLDVYGGEWKYDNYTATLYQNRGADRGVTIRYGKNLTALSQEIDTSNLVTGIIPFYIDPEGNKTIGNRMATGLDIGRTQDVAIDFSMDVDPESIMPITAQLSMLAYRYKNNNNLTVPINSITLNFEQLQDLAERVDLCDTVKIYFEALGIEGSAECIETVWDVLHEKYTSTTFGDARTNIADTLVQQQRELSATPSTSYMANAISQATALITGNLGGYVVFHDSDNDGQPDEILIMNTPDIATATNVWRWNKNGLGYSSDGYDGPYGLAMTSEGEIVADFITTGTLNANLIKAGVISDVDGNSTIDMESGIATLYNFRAKNELKLLGNDNVVKAEIVHNDGSGTNFELFNENSKGCIIIDSGTRGGVISVADENGNTTLQLIGHDGQFFVLDTNRNTRIYMTNNGGIGFFNSSGTNTITASGSNGNITCVSLTQTSSRKVKENIKPIEDAKKILDLNAVSFDYKNKEQGTNKRGFIAEDVAEVLPNLVTPETEETPATLDYIGMIPYLQDVLKAQAAEIKELKAELAKIKNKVGG